MRNLKQILQEFSKQYGVQAKALEQKVLAYVQAGYSADEAIIKAMDSVEFKAKFEQMVREAQSNSATLGIGNTAVKSEALTAALESPWDSSSMTLSEKLHGTEIMMRNAIASTLKDQMTLGSSAVETAKALYDGYGYGHVIKEQELPGYLKDLTAFARHSNLSAKESNMLLRSIRRAQRQIDSMGDSASNKGGLKASYRELLNAVKLGNEKNIERATYVAINEKSRAVAERIARTESARAYFEGVTAKWGKDSLCVAYRWELGSSHPDYDLCDMYAEVDMFNLGAGVYPKNMVPELPVHPNCMCRLEPVFQGEVDMNKRKDQSTEAGKKWLDKQSSVNRAHILGVRGAKDYEKDGDWKGRAFNFKPPINPESRLSDLTESGIINIQIDELTPCLRDSKTGELLDTNYSRIKISPILAKQLQDEGWMFNWADNSLRDSDIFQLKVNGVDTIQGLVALEKDMGFLNVRLVESNPKNVGKKGQLKGVGGHMFAIACSKSFKSDREGFVGFVAKTNLVKHYQETLGATIVHGDVMQIDTAAAKRIMKIYGEEWGK